MPRRRGRASSPPGGGRRAFLLAQGFAAVVLLARLSRGRERHPPLGAGGTRAPSGTVSVVVPARDEVTRLGPCLEALRDDPDVDEVVVVDDRSTDGTARLAAELGARVVPGAPLPDGWVGKPWALQQGLEAARGDIVVTLDADTRPRAGLARALAAALDDAQLVSATARFACHSRAERLLHPSMLATLVYRVGPVDAAGRPPRPSRAVINGQCVAARRADLVGAGGFAAARAHMTDDIALARALAARGWRLRVVDGGDLLEVRMYTSGRETWREWGRSIAMADVTSPAWLAADVALVWLTMALPLPRLLLRRGTWLDGLLLVVRLLLHAGLARSYRPRGAAYWLAPSVDVAAAVRLAASAVRPRRVWRGRAY